MYIPLCIHVCIYIFNYVQIQLYIYIYTYLKMVAPQKHLFQYHNGPILDDVGRTPITEDPWIWHPPGRYLRIETLKKKMAG